MKSVFWWRKPEYPKETTEAVLHEFSVVYWGLTPQQQPGAHGDGDYDDDDGDDDNDDEMSVSLVAGSGVAYPEEISDLRQVTDKVFRATWKRG